MKTKILLPILFGALVLVACKKDPPPPDASTVIMPPLTHQGLNTFGCYVNGKLFVANEGESVWSLPPVSGDFDEEDGSFIIQGSRQYDTLSDYIYILSDITAGVGEYDFKVNEDGILGYSGIIGPKCEYFYKDIPNLGKLTITHLDEEKNIISGSFYMNLINDDCEESDTLMKITDGRFDMRY